MIKKLRLFLFLFLVVLNSTGLNSQTAVQPAGSGTAGDPYRISTLSNLYWLSQNSEHWDKHYLQIANIDASATANWNGGEGWEPIGISADEPFSGVYDGDNHTISNLFIDRDAPDQGLFGRTGVGSVIRNLGVLNASITATHHLGAIAGYSSALIENCYSSGIISSGIQSGRNVGGLIGTNLGTIENSNSSATVSGGENAGGLVGLSHVGSNIRHSYSEGVVNSLASGSGNVGFGGLAGTNWGTISFSYSTATVYGASMSGCLVGRNHSGIQDSYSTGNIEGTQHVGGLAGYNEGIVRRSYSTGKPEGQEDVGGLIGTIFDHPDRHLEITLSFWDTSSSGTATSAAGTGLSTTGMIDPDTFSEWDFADIWGIQAGETYPFLQWQIEPGIHNYPNLYAVVLQALPAAGGTTDGAGGYEPGDPVTVTATPAPGYIFINWTDDLGNELSNQESYQFTMPGENMRLSANFAPITLSVEIYPAGAGGTVSINPEKPLYNEGEQVTLTAETQEAWIFVNWTDEEDNVISDQLSFVYTMPGHAVTLTANFGHLFDGGEGTGENPWEIATAEQLDNIRQYVGDNHADKHFILTADIDLGTAPWNSGEGWVPIGLHESFHGNLDGDGKKITGLYIRQPTSGALPTNAGLFYLLDGAVVRNLIIEDADIFGSVSAGALAGSLRNSALIENCSSSGNIEVHADWGDECVGGLVGQNRDSRITGSYSSATVLGNWNSGGLVGDNLLGEIINSYSTGSVEGKGSVGGLAGKNENGLISGCFSSGDVIGTSPSAGGLVGWNSGSNAEITNSYSVSRVRGTSAVGGLAGSNMNSATVSNSYSTGNVYGSQLNIGGLIGSSAANAVVENCFWDIRTSGQEESAGGDGATGYETSVMTTFDLYVSDGGWDFDVVWEIVANKTYPFHKWQSGAGPHNDPPEFHTLTLATDPEPAGIVEEAKDYPQGGYIPVSVTPNEGFRFDRWIDDGDQEVSTDPGFVYTMPERDVTLTAKFTPVNLTVVINPPGSGTVEISPVKDYYDIGDEITLTAISAGGYKFMRWTDDEENELGTGEVLPYTMDQDDMVLTAHFSQEFAGGSGTSADPWLIGTAEHLVNVRNYLGAAHDDKHFLQIADIDLDVAPYNQGEGWEPMGTGPASFFSGRYDGGQHIISGLYINRPETDNQGLFSEVLSGARLENMVLEEVNIKGWRNVGAIAGSIYGAMVKNSSASGVVEGNTSVGILAGLAGDSRVENCNTSGSVSGHTDVGGLVGLAGGNNSEVLYCHSTADVTGEGNVGGLAGRSGQYTYEDPLIHGSYSTGIVTGNNHSVGGLAGRNYGGISESHSTGPVTAGGWYVGGLVGYLDQGSVTESYSTGSVTSTRSDASYAGGLIGVVSNSSVENSYSTGDVTGYGRVGGLAGQMTGGTVTSCYSTGKVEGDSNVGGLVGLNMSGTVENSFWNTETSWQTEGATGEGKTTADMVRVASFEDWDFAGTWSLIEEESYPFLLWQTEPAGHNYPDLYNLTINIIPEDAGTVEGDGLRPGGGLIALSAQVPGGTVFTGWTDDQGNELSSDENFLFEMPAENVTINALFEVRFAGGQGTEEEPWQIETAMHLDNVRLYTGWDHDDKHFLQVADIDLGAAPWNEGEGWEPIGTDLNNSFMGTFNGDGHKIEGLFIDRPQSNNTGLFGYAQLAELSDVHIINANITGKENVGIISGYLDATRISGSSSSGTVSGTGAVGGLAGRLFGHCVIENSRSSAGVKGDWNFVGGLAGFMIYGGSIINSFSTGYAIGNIGVGGLVGLAEEDTEIENSYSTASVAGPGNIGGLAGEFRGTVIRSSYSTGPVSGEENVGGLVGMGNAAKVENSYWNTESSGQETSAGGEGKTTAEMISGSTFTGWDFTGTWNIEEGESYPWLTWQLEVGGHNFPAELYTLGLDVEPQEGGSAEGEGIYPENGLVFLAATPNPGFYFGGWRNEEGNIVSMEPGWIFTMPSENLALTAVFLPITITVTINPEDGGSVEITPDKDVYLEHEGIGLIATPNEGYEFAGWTDEDGNVLYEGESWYFTMPGEAITVIANFLPVDYTLTVSVTPDGSGTIAIDPEKEHYNAGDEIMLSAAAIGEYQFIRWTDGDGNELSTDSDFTFTMPAGNANLSAIFDIANTVTDPAAGGLTVSPVPAADYIIIESERQMREFRLIGLSGQILMHAVINNFTKEIGIGHLSTGIYLLQVEIEPYGEVVTRRVVISR